MHILVKWNDNWADEMDLDGFAVFSEEQYEEYCKVMEKRLNRGSWEFFIGTNESVEYNSYQSLTGRFVTKKITEFDLDILIDLFGANNDYRDKEECLMEYGFFPFYSCDDDPDIEYKDWEDDE